MQLKTAAVSVIIIRYYNYCYNYYYYFYFCCYYYLLLILLLICHSDDWRTIREKIFNSFYFRENGVADLSTTTSSTLSFSTLRGVLTTAYRVKVSIEEVFALGHELEVVKKVKGEVVVDFTALLVKLKRLGTLLT